MAEFFVLTHKYGKDFEEIICENDSNFGRFQRILICGKLDYFLRREQNMKLQFDISIQRETELRHKM